jgi:hypothetical protein
MSVFVKKEKLLKKELSVLMTILRILNVALVVENIHILNFLAMIGQHMKKTNRID